MASIIQANLRRGYMALAMLQQFSREQASEILLVSEPPPDAATRLGWHVSRDGGAAIILDPPPRLPPTSGSGRGFVWVKLGGAIIVSCYFSPRFSPRRFTRRLQALEATLNRISGPTDRILLAGDLNAKATAWGAPDNDAKGNILLDFAIANGFAIENRGNKPTYRDTKGGTSHIDVTLTRRWASRGWRVRDDAFAYSDHHFITYVLETPNLEPLPHTPSIVWCRRKIEYDKLFKYVSEQIATPISTHQQLHDTLTGASDACMPRHRPAKNRRSMYWWGENIAEARRECIRAYRRLKRRIRERGTTGAQAERTIYRDKKKELRNLIRKSKEKAWGEVCMAVENDPWGLPYKIVTGKLLGRTAPRHNFEPDHEYNIASELFPQQPPTNWADHPLPPVVEEPTPFSIAEVIMAARRLPSGKAAGPDGIIPEILKAIAIHKPEIILQTFNSILTSGSFPRAWKEARLVLLHKGGDRDPGDPSSFRPISVINTEAKLMERLILNRLDAHLDSTANGRSDNQFGFRRGRSTLDALERVRETAGWTNRGPPQHRDLCALVLFDVRNAFNTLPWRAIDRALEHKRTPLYLRGLIRSYLMDRVLRARSGVVDLTGGVPQGSVLGPTLWNIVYDELLDMPTEPGTRLIGFADDLALVTTARDPENLENIMNRTIRDIDRWMTDKGLQIVPSKTKAIILTRKKVPPTLSLLLRGQTIPVEKEARYLGVTLDTRMSFLSHIDKAANNTRGTIAALSKLMPNVGGPSNNKRRLLMSVANSRLLYAAPIWADSVSKCNKGREAILGAQRIAAIRIIRSYKTVSRVAALALADTPPANLLVIEEARVRDRITSNSDLTRSKVRLEERQRTINAWCALWRADPSSARVTKKLLPDLRRWLNRPREVVTTYHLTQLLTGHGCFGAYLARIGRVPSPRCPYCGDPDDTVFHTFFDCHIWEDSRAPTVVLLGQPVVPEMVQTLLCGPPNLPTSPFYNRAWPPVVGTPLLRTHFLDMVENILTRKEADERGVQADARVRGNITRAARSRRRHPLIL